MLGYRLRALRCSKGLTLTAIGKAVGVSHATVSRWETGANGASLNTHQLVAFLNACQASDADRLAILQDDTPTEATKTRQDAPAFPSVVAA